MSKTGFPTVKMHLWRTDIQAVNLGLFRTGKGRTGKWRRPAVRRLLRVAQRPAEFAQLLEQIGVSQDALVAASSQLESQFLKTGSELERLAEYGDRFVKQVEQLIGLATGKHCDNAVFIDAIGLIEETTNFLGACEKETGEMLELLKTYESQIADLLGVEASLQQAMLPLNIVQTLFRMESAPLGLEVQQMFTALTQEIEVLHTQMRDIFGTKFQQLEQTRHTIRQVIQKLERQVGSLREVTTMRKQQIESSLATLKKEMLNNQDRDVRLSRLSHDLAREVEQVVMGLQAHDIVNQKLQHVGAALPHILTQAAYPARLADPEAVKGAIQFVRQSSRLEADQLQLAGQELAGAEAAIRVGMEKILCHLSEMDSRCLSLEEFTLLTTSFDGIVQVLVETIEEVRTLVAETVTNAAEAYELLRPLGTLASDLTEVIRKMSGKIQLIGLNAQVKAAQAAQSCRGGGLEVLSARTSEISLETSRISEQAASQLDALVSGLAQTVKAFAGLQSRGQAHQTLLDRQGRAHEQALHAIRDRGLETLRGIGTSLEEIKKQAQRALASVDFKAFHEKNLPALEQPLRALSNVAEAWLRAHQFALVETNLVEKFKHDYTMASERKVFADAVATHAAPPDTGAPDTTLIGPGQDSASRLLQLSPLPRPEPDKEPALAPSRPAGELGANVELF